MAIQVIKYRAMDKGSLRGFISVKLDAIPTMEIHDIAHFDGGNGPGIGLPNRTYEKKDGTTGRNYYVYIADDGVRAAFEKGVLEALNVYFQQNPDKAPGAAQASGGTAPVQDDIPF